MQGILSAEPLRLQSGNFLPLAFWRKPCAKALRLCQPKSSHTARHSIYPPPRAKYCADDAPCNLACILMEGQPVGTHDTKVWSTPVQSPLPLLSQRRVVNRKDADLKQAVSSCFFPSHFNSRRSTAGGSPANSSWRLNSKPGHSNPRGGSSREDDGYWLVGGRLVSTVGLAG